MSNTKSKQTSPGPHDSVITVKDDGTDPQLQFAKAVSRSESLAATSIESFANYQPKLDLNCLIEVLRSSTSSVASGDLNGPESMLNAQTHTLDFLFNDLIRRAAHYVESPDLYEKYLRLAFKAQSQCRATIGSIADIRQPRVYMGNVDQANISSGHQQVNNGQPHSQNQKKRKTN